jgi:hypothetical protein
MAELVRGEPGGVVRGRKEGEGWQHRRQPSPLPPRCPTETSSLSLARESQRAWLALGQWQEGSREANGKEWPGGGGSLLLSGRGMPKVFAVVVWGSDRGLARACAASLLLEGRG